VHSTGGYMVYAATTTKYVFNLGPGDTFWCTADCGWITGHSYLAYGPLLNGATNVVFEGVPTHPTPARCWKVRALTSSPRPCTCVRTKQQPVLMLARVVRRVVGEHDALKPSKQHWLSCMQAHRQAPCTLPMPHATRPGVDQAVVIMCLSMPRDAQDMTPCSSLLTGGREVQGEAVLHRPHCHQVADALW
jgi:hypothetical protein